MCEPVIALYNYSANNDDEIDIEEGDQLVVLETLESDWLKVKNDQDVTGYVPTSYIKDYKAQTDNNTNSEKSTKCFQAQVDNGPKNGEAASIANKLKTAMGARNTKQKINNNISIEHHSSPFKFNNKLSDVYVAKFDYKPVQKDELELKKGDVVTVTIKENDGWWQGRTKGIVGWFPCNYVIDDKESHSPDYAVPEDLLLNLKDFHIDVICTVKTLYPFNTQTAEELAFDKDIILQIIEKPKDDPDWWKARTFSGETGLVPRNYVQEINGYTGGGSASTLNARGVNTECSFVNQEWFHGSISRNDCEKLLWNYGMVGEFLLRESESRVGDYSLSVNAPKKTKHFKIKAIDDCFTIGQRTFNSMEELITHYKKTAILTEENGEKVFLKKAFSKTGAC